MTTFHKCVSAAAHPIFTLSLSSSALSLSSLDRLSRPFHISVIIGLDLKPAYANKPPGVISHHGHDDHEPFGRIVRVKLFSVEVAKKT